MNKRIIVYSLGKLMVMAAALFLAPALVSLIFREGRAFCFLIPGFLMFAAGALCLRFKPKRHKSYAKEGFVTVAFMWIAFSVFGALPFMLDGCIPSFVDAFFETVSGFTTTGSTILTDVESLARSLLFWRSFTHWVGGMGVLALAIAVLPSSRGNDDERDSAVHLLRAESPGPTFGKLVSKLSRNSRILYGIYTVMTLCEIVLLLAGGMPLFDSIVNSFGTAGTGGFGIKNASIGFYDSAYFDYVIGIFMILFGVNFNVYYFLLTGNLLKFLKSEEIKWYFGIIAAAVGVITVNIASLCDSVGEALRYAFFQVASIITTTGFVTADYELWPTLSKTVLVLLMFIGACAGSTGGGLKVSRVIILLKTAVKELRYQINPREVRAVRCDGEPVDHSVVTGVSSYFGIYMIIMALSTLLISFDGKDPTTTFTAVTACLNNIGPGLSEVGATGNFSGFSDFAKLVLSFDMLAGRLELYPMLIAFSPSMWKRSL
ncbi:MAG: TrkH family potassium uptake protein [Ruminococcaceae bacterium]|nr:TrkH family potassium uptake protein [Oscillospiraceae bacterium]